MTRKSRRKIERELEDIQDDDGATRIRVVRQMADGSRYDLDGRPVPEGSGDLLIHHPREAEQY